MYHKILLALVLTISLTACAPDMTDNNNYNFNISLGQELIDLKKALDEGAINDEEYKEMVDSLKKSRFND